MKKKMFCAKKVTKLLDLTVPLEYRKFRTSTREIRDCWYMHTQLHTHLTTTISWHINRHRYRSFISLCRRLFHCSLISIPPFFSAVQYSIFKFCIYKVLNSNLFFSDKYSKMNKNILMGLFCIFATVDRTE